MLFSHPPEHTELPELPCRILPGGSILTPSGVSLASQMLMTALIAAFPLNQSSLSEPWFAPFLHILVLKHQLWPLIKEFWLPFVRFSAGVRAILVPITLTFWISKMWAPSVQTGNTTFWAVHIKEFWLPSWRFLCSTCESHFGSHHINILKRWIYSQAQGPNKEDYKGW